MSKDSVTQMTCHNMLYRRAVPRMFHEITAFTIAYDWVGLNQIGQ